MLRKPKFSEHLAGTQELHILGLGMAEHVPTLYKALSLIPVQETKQKGFRSVSWLKA